MTLPSLLFVFAFAAAEMEMLGRPGRFFGAFGAAAARWAATLAASSGATSRKPRGAPSPEGVPEKRRQNRVEAAGKDYM